MGGLKITTVRNLYKHWKFDKLGKLCGRIYFSRVLSCMRAKELLQLIPEEYFHQFAVETKVDHQVKKLSGQIIFQLFLFSMINKKRVSLRVMEEFLKSSSFRNLSDESEIDAKYNSISDRLSMIKAEYFEKIFYAAYERFSKHLNEESEIYRYDSTMIAVSSKLFDWGMRVGAKAKNPAKTEKLQLKFSVGMHGSFPSYIEIFSGQEDLSEDIALKKAILNNTNNRGNIITFDRGLASRKSFDDISNENIWFVTRTNLTAKYEVISENKIPEKPEQATVQIQKDLNVMFPITKNMGSQNRFRLVKGTIDRTGEEIYFVSNIVELDCYEIASIYKKRWAIESLFKLLKQELNISHIISRNLNGIKVMVYMTLITSILIIAFRKLNSISSYKIAKLRLSIELENELIGQIVVLCGGDLNKYNQIYGP